jgi:hypothetical protein
MCLTICPAALCSIEDNNLRAEGGMKLAEAFAEMPNLREVKCVLAPHVQTARPWNRWIPALIDLPYLE